MSFAILHMKKLKQPAIKGIQIHNQRERESQTNPDIDESKSHLNYDLVNSESIDYNEKINKMIEEGVTTGKKIRKDAVRLASFLVTSDKSFFDGLTPDREKEFFKTAYEYFCHEYGKDKIAFSVVHKDEHTPHMHVGFVPITEDGRLSAKDFFGKKSQMFALQDRFYEHMKEAGFELDRGVSSDRKHIETAKFKAETLERKNKFLEKEIKQYENLKEKIEKIDSIEFKEQKSIFQKDSTVILSKTDFENMQNDLKKAIVTRDDRNELLKQIDQAKIEISDLKNKNEELKFEIKYLKRDVAIEKDLNNKLTQENKQLKETNEKLKKHNQRLMRELIKISEQYRETMFKIAAKLNAIKEKVPLEFINDFVRHFEKMKEAFKVENKKEIENKKEVKQSKKDIELER